MMPAGAEAAKLSIITASHNRRELLLAKLESLRRQTLPAERFEWLVCLDGATDGSAAALRAALAQDEAPFTVTILELRESQGAGAARNRCAAAARHGTLYLSDDDCLLLPFTLERHAAAQAEGPGVLLGGITFRPDASGRPLGEWQQRRPRYWHVNGANTSLPATAFHAAGGFPGWLSGYGGEDIVLGFQLERSGLPIRMIDGAGVIHEGANTAAGADPHKSWQAGRNAARIAARYPQTASRLGVARWQLGLKRALLPVFTPLLGMRGQAEMAYARGAAAEQRSSSRIEGKAGR
jgi:glycosyltransferase involved in cell wall biosynthesis